MAKAVRALAHAIAVGSALTLVAAATGPSAAADTEIVVPAPFTPAVALKRQAIFLANAANAQQQPALTPEVVEAYVKRQQALKNFNGFDVVVQPAALTEDVLLGYIAKRRNNALEAIEQVDVTDGPALTQAVLSAYAAKDYVPTTKKVKIADEEKLCLAQAIYHEARGESQEGQLAVANVIINRAMSKKYPSTICGVVFQNADKGRFKCQFTFACDGRSDMGSERGAWRRSVKLAEQAFYEFQRGERPGVVPNSVLYYHTTSVSPRWANTFHRVAAIGSHVFYAQN